MAGKLKMAVQCFAIIVILWVFRSGGPDQNRSITMLRDVLIWASLALTIYSGGAYLARAKSIFKNIDKGASA